MTAFLTELRERFTAPGAEFELRVEDVRGVPLPVFANRRTRLREWLVDSTAHGDLECVVQGDVRLSFAEHAEHVASLAAVLAEEYGVRPGDRVAILAANSPQWLLAFWAANSLGAVVAAGNAWWTAPEAGYSLGRVGPTVVVADAKRARLVEGMPLLRIEEILDRVAARGPAELPDVAVGEDDPALIMYTSGTTGHPKGATHSHRNLLAVIEYHRLGDAVAAEVAALTGLPARTEPRRYLLSSPLFHIAALHNLALPRVATGDTVVVDAGRFEPDRVLRLVQDERVTNWAIVPTMAHRLVQHGTDAYDLSALAAMSINSAPSSPALKERVRTAIPTVSASLADSYGLTEISTAATVATALDLEEAPLSVGRPIAGVELRVVDGEVQVRGQFTMLGYWDDPEATARAIDADGWFHTGDLGRLDGDRLYLDSRRSDLILRGGENVYPAEIEAVLDQHPDVVECAVFGVEDEDLGQAVAAVVVGTAGEDELRDWAAERLAYYKVPSRWRVSREPLRRNATGKVIRRSLTV